MAALKTLWDASPLRKKNKKNQTTGIRSNSEAPALPVVETRVFAVSFRRISG